MVLAIVIVLVVGLAFIFGSYIFSEKLEKNEEAEKAIKIPDQLTKEQKKKIDKLINDYMGKKVNGKLDDKVSDAEKKLSEIVNQKTLALGDYAVTVNEESEKNHKEVMFLYSMLQDKQKEIMTTASMVDDVKNEVKDIVDDSKTAKKEEPAKKEKNAKKEKSEAPEVKEQETEQAPAAEETVKEEAKEEAVEASEPAAEEPAKEASEDNKDVILEMHKSGLSILEIAKHLGMGVGEVKLVVDLYNK